MNNESSKSPVTLGQAVYFDPFVYISNFYGRADMMGKIVRGTVVYVNKEHRWFSVAYDGHTTSFPFHEVGKGVQL